MSDASPHTATAPPEPRSRLVTWHDPLDVAAKAKELPGRQFLQMIVDGSMPPPPMAELVGARLESVGEGEAVFRCAPDGSVYNESAMVHGGLLCTMLDFAAGCAVQTLLPAGTGSSSIEIKVSFFKALRAETGEIEIRGRALQVGRRVAFAEAHARDLRGELIGHATTSFAVRTRQYGPATS